MATGDATAQSMLLGFSDIELSQLCSGNFDAGTPAATLITPVLFRKAILGEDLSGEPQDVQDALATAKLTFDYAVNRANSFKNNELRGFDIYADAELLIQGHVNAIARYYLSDLENLQGSGDSGVMSNIQRKYEDAVKFLHEKQGCSPCGKSPIGSVDLDKAGNQLDAISSNPDQVFTDAYFAGYNA